MSKKLLYYVIYVYNKVSNYRQMAAILKSSNNSVAAIYSNSSAFGQTVNIQLSGADNETNFVCMNQAQLRLRVQNCPTSTNIKRPVLGWISVYDITLNFTDGSTKRFATQANRGLVGNILQLSNNSFANTVDNQTNNLITNGGTSTLNTNSEFSIQLQYLVDAFMSKKYLSIKNMTMNVTFESVENIFEGPLTSTPILSGIWLDFQTYKLDLSRTESRLLHYDIHAIYVAGGYISAQSSNSNSVSFTQTLSIPGSLMCLFYCFMPVNSNDKKIYNAWSNSVVKYHSLQSMSNKLYPTNPNYDTIDGTTVGLNRHYNEYMSAINKLCPNSDTYVTFDKYLSDYRFYTISTYNHKMTSGSYTLQITQTTPTPVDVKVLIFGLYIPTEYYNVGDHVRMG